MRAMAMISEETSRKFERLRSGIADLESVIVAYSGGVDSSLVAQVAHETLGTNSALIVTADSPSLARYELRGAASLAEARGWNHLLIATQEMDDARYVDNDGYRCFFCKSELYSRLSELALEKGIKAIANGANRDDLGDYRPGMKAASDFKIHSPLVDAGLHKEDVRIIARAVGLPNWDKPAQPCLSSRIPYGMRVTVDALRMVAKAEKHLKEMGFTQCRVRHYGSSAKVEIEHHQIPVYLDPDVKCKAEAGILAVGYDSVELNPEGFRSGRLNDALSR